ncbi:MAG: hypothetical protein ABJ360_11045, partial [Roseobacter sp.]
MIAYSKTRSLKSKTATLTCLSLSAAWLVAAPNIALAQTTTPDSIIVLPGDPDDRLKIENDTLGGGSIGNGDVFTEEEQEELERQIRKVALGVRSQEFKEQKIQDIIAGALRTKNIDVNQSGSGLGSVFGPCVQQFDPITDSLAITASSLGLAGGIAEAAGSILGVLGSETPGVVTQLVGDGIGLGNDILSTYVNTLDFCSSTFTGTVTGLANANFGQGVSTFGGAITLGNP